MHLTHVVLAVAVLAAVTGCDDSATTAGPAADPDPTPSADALPYFDSPRAAATYLATTWNADDADALHHITNDASRAQLADMRTFADDMRLEGCTKDPDGAYTCTFDHGFLPGKEDEDVDADEVPGDEGPAPADHPHHGKAGLRAVAVDRTGWYFNVFLYCG